MKEENLIHIKLEYNEAVQSKRDILSSEMNLLRIMRKIRQYQSLRLNELKIKTNLQKKVRAVKRDIKSVQLILPQIKMPAILQKNKPEEAPKEPVIEKKIYDTDLELELKDIQRKLKEIERV